MVLFNTEELQVTPLDRITFVVEGVPVPKGRPRFAKVGNVLRTYTPEATARYETLVRWRAREAVAKHGWVIGEDDVCRLKLVVNRQYLIKGGDCDNIAKAIGDACNGTLYTDDCRVVSASVELHALGLTPSVQVTCERFDRKDWV